MITLNEIEKVDKNEVLSDNCPCIRFVCEILRNRGCNVPSLYLKDESEYSFLSALSEIRKYLVEDESGEIIFGTLFENFPDMPHLGMLCGGGRVVHLVGGKIRVNKLSVFKNTRRFSWIND